MAARRMRRRCSGDSADHEPSSCRKSEESKSGEGDDQQDRDEHPADGGGVTEVAGVESDDEEVHYDGQTAAIGSGALEEDEGKLEELKSADHADEDHKDQHGANAGEGDVEESIPRSGAVDFGGFV